jgi:hypothetical protein
VRHCAAPLHDGCNGVWKTCFCQAEVEQSPGKGGAKPRQRSGKKTCLTMFFSPHVRAGTCHRSRMKTSQRQLKAMQRDVRQGPDRSTLFWWMVDHHDYLVVEGRRGRMPWLKLCKRFAVEGLTDGSGKPATPKRAGETWREACVEVKAAAERVAATAQMRRPPPPAPRLAAAIGPHRATIDAPRKSAAADQSSSYSGR